MTAFLVLFCEEISCQRVSGICHFACGVEKGMVGHSLCHKGTCITKKHLPWRSVEFGQDPRSTIDYCVHLGKLLTLLTLTLL